jgi:RHS repeat-associated protein
MTKLFAYDKLGRVKTETRTISNNGGTYTNDYAYDLFNRHHTITYPSDPVNGERLRVNYSYNEDGIDSVSYVLGSEKRTVISDIKYNEFGQQSRVTRGNNTRTEYIYDIKGRLKKLTSLAKDNGYDYAVQNVRYDFNSDNSIASVENSPELAFTGLMDGTIRHDYMYDGLNRLITAEGEVRINDHEAEYYKREFAYSPNGNLLTKKMMDRGTKTDSANWSYTYKNHAVASVTQNGMPVFNMSYDASGNMTSQIDNHRDMIKNIAYDSKNRMISVTDKNGNTVGNYEYDEQGFRVRKTARAEGEGGDKTVEILYPSMYHGIERTKATARSTSDSDSYAVNNIYVNGIRIAAVSGDGAERHYFTDQVDSVKLVMDGDGKPIKAFEYLPYGETWLQKGESNDKPKYNSQELDDETGYYYYNARHYDAALARFVTADTVVDGEYSVAGWNRYMYCAGNPVLYKDPTGHSWQTMQQEFRKGILDSQDIDSRLQTEQKAFDLERTGADCVDSLESKLHDNRVENGWKTEMQSGDKTALANYIDNVYSDSVPVWAYDGKEYNKVKLEYDENADQSVMNNNYRNTLKEALFCSGNMSATITSTYRNSYNQARVMYDNVRNRGLQSQYKLYGKSGDSVLDQYNSSLSRDKAILKMQKQIEQIENNGGWVSAHGGNYNIRGAFDISPLSLINKKAFSDQLIKMKNSGEIEKYILPSSSEPAYHIELKNK